MSPPTGLSSTAPATAQLLLRRRGSFLRMALATALGPAALAASDFFALRYLRACFASSCARRSA